MKIFVHSNKNILNFKKARVVFENAIDSEDLILYPFEYDSFNVYAKDIPQGDSGRIYENIPSPFIDKDGNLIPGYFDFSRSIKEVITKGGREAYEAFTVYFERVVDISRYDLAATTERRALFNHFDRSWLGKGDATDFVKEKWLNILYNDRINDNMIFRYQDLLKDELCYEVRETIIQRSFTKGEKEALKNKIAEFLQRDSLFLQFKGGYVFFVINNHFVLTECVTRF